MASPPPFNKRRALQQFIARNPNVGLKKRGPGAPGSVSPPSKQYGSGPSAAYKNRLAAEARKQQSGGATAVATQDYKNRLAAAMRNQQSGPKKPGLPGKRKFPNNAPFARY